MREFQNMKIGTHCILACLYFLLLPTTVAINSAGNSYLKLASIPIAAYFVVTIIVSKKPLQFNAVHLLLCLYTLSTLITLFIKYDSTSINTVIGYFLNTALFLCLTVVRYNKKELSLIESTQVLLLFVLVVITLLSEGMSDDRATLMIFGQKSDPNYFVGFFIFPLCVTIKKIIESKYRLLYLLLAVFSIYCVFLSGSRGGLLAVIVLIIAFALIYPTKIKTKVIVLLTGCSLLLCTWLFVMPFLPETVVERMSIDAVIESGGSGRWYVWEYMLDEIVNTPSKLILGRGFHAIQKIFVDGEWSHAIAHNHMIQTLYDQGVVGLIAFIILTVGTFIYCIRKRKTVSIAIIGMMALAISLTFNPTTRTFWNLVAYAAFNFPENEYNASKKILKIAEEDQ